MDVHGDMTVTNLKTREETRIEFKRVGWTNANKCKFEGRVFTADNEPVIIIHGRWNEKIYFKNIKTGEDQCVWNINERLEN